MFKLPLVLDIIASDGDEEDREYLEDMGLTSIYDEPTFPIVFYSIDHIHEDVRSTQEEPLCVVFSGGESYITKHSLISLAKMIASCH
jgi:hypothetical protein